MLETNREGQTYGSLMNARTDQYPDLVAVLDDEGIQGYIYFEDVFCTPQTPISTKVYAEDGYTQTGIFTFGNK